MHTSAPPRPARVRPGTPMDLPRLFQTPADVATFALQAGLDTGDRATIARGRGFLDAQVELLLDWWLHLAQDGVGRTVLPQTPAGEVDHAALAAARPHLRAWLAAASGAAYDQSWLEQQRRIATQLGRPPHLRGSGPDGWMALLPFFALVVEGLPRILGDDARVRALQAAWRKAMQVHLTAWVTAA